MATKATIYEKGKLYDLDITKVQPDPEQPRKFFDEQALAELSASITSHGVVAADSGARGGGWGVYNRLRGEAVSGGEECRIGGHPGDPYRR